MKQTKFQKRLVNKYCSQIQTHRRLLNECQFLKMSFCRSKYNLCARERLSASAGSAVCMIKWKDVSHVNTSSGDKHLPITASGNLAARAACTNR